MKAEEYGPKVIILEKEDFISQRPFFDYWRCHELISIAPLICNNIYLSIYMGALAGDAVGRLVNSVENKNIHFSDRERIWLSNFVRLKGEFEIIKSSEDQIGVFAIIMNSISENMDQ